MNISKNLFSDRVVLRGKRAAALIILLAAILAAGVVLSLSCGASGVSLGQAVKAMLAGEKQSAVLRIFLYVRLPRTLAAVFAGAGLAVSGVLIQAVLGNPMAAPNIIGVNSGAGLAVMLLTALFPTAAAFLPAAAFAGALAASLCVYAIAAKTGAGRLTVTLAGIAVSSILGAGINMVKTLFPDSVYDGGAFLIGGLSGVSLGKVTWASLIIAVGLILSCLLSRAVDIVALGTQAASGLGMRVGVARFGILMLASALAGAAVSFAGLLGFVGLIVPHMARAVTGGRHSVLIPVSALGGAALVVFCDLASRTLFSPYELPVGIIMSFIGGPFFITMVLGRRGDRP